MSCKIATFFCLLSAASLGTAVAATPANSSAPTTYVYVAQTPGQTSRVAGYRVSSTGQLTKISGSPFAAKLGNMSATPTLLFGVQATGYTQNVSSFQIESNGALKYLTTRNVQNDTGLNPVDTILDHSGATLYVFSSDGDYGDFASYSIAKPSGKLTYLSKTVGEPDSNTLPLTFLANNKLAYWAVCDFQEGTSEIFGFQRKSNGSLVDLSIDAQYPTAPGDTAYCPQYGTADPTDHLAVDETIPGGTTADQIASYTADTSNGDLNTTSTAENMPHTAVVTVQAMRMSYSGKLLAVGGTNGLQIFHFNGADPVTVDTGLLTSDDIESLTWDQNNRLYATSLSHNKLFVFNVTSSGGAKQAPGSPYSVANPWSVTVQAK